jgi:hypothetical protein
MSPFIEYSLPKADEEVLDAALQNVPEFGPVPENWRLFVAAVPSDFYLLMWDTIEKYKTLRETEKVFPALEAIFIEARNSLPNA